MHQLLVTKQLRGCVLVDVHKSHFGLKYEYSGVLLGVLIIFCLLQAAKERKKPNRIFRDQWAIDYPWVRYVAATDEDHPATMYCTICREQGVLVHLGGGTTVMKKDTLRDHHKCDSHIACQKKHNQQQKAPRLAAQ